MTFYVQHGYGKADKLNVLADEGSLGGVILSPADEGRVALRATARAMARRGVETLLDPQTYVYTISNGVARCHDEVGLDFGHLYWASITPADIERHVEAVLRANAEVGTTGPIIAPGPRQGTLGDLWLPLALQYARTTSTRAGDRSALASVVVEEAGLSDWGRIERWLDVATTLEVRGFYVIVGRRSAYPSAWDRAPLSNLLRLVYRLAVLNEYQLLVGYADLPGLAAIGFGATGIASGWNYRQRQFVSDRWIPRGGGQSPVPRVTSPTALAPFLAQGEMDGAVRTSIGPRVLPDPALRDVLANRAASWTNPQAVIQHLVVLAELVRELESAGQLSDRLDRLATTTTEARRLIRDLAAQGVPIEPVHLTAVSVMASAISDARRAEGI